MIIPVLLRRFIPVYEQYSITGLLYESNSLHPPGKILYGISVLMLIPAFIFLLIGMFTFAIRYFKWFSYLVGLSFIFCGFIPTFVDFGTTILFPNPILIIYAYAILGIIGILIIYIARTYESDPVLCNVYMIAISVLFLLLIIIGTLGCGSYISASYIIFHMIFLGGVAMPILWIFILVLSIYSYKERDRMIAHLILVTIHPLLVMLILQVSILGLMVGE